VKLEMENSGTLTIDRKLEILHNVINKIVGQLDKPEAILKLSVTDLIRLLEMETELAAKVAPQKTVIQWIDPYLNETLSETGSETKVEPEADPAKTA